MKKVKHILVTFLHSFIPQDSYYSKLLHIPFQSSLTYYITIIIFFACVMTGTVVYRYSPLQMINFKNAIVQSLSTFPEEGKIGIKNGILESNQNKPLFLWVYQSDQPLFVIMVDPKETLTRIRLPLPLIFLGRDTAQISYRGNTIVREYDSTWNISVSKVSIQSFIKKVNSSFPPFIFFFYIFLITIVPLIFILCVTLSILLSAACTFVLLCTFIPHIRLKKCIQASMHGTHIPLLIIILLFSLFPSMVNIHAIAISLIFVFTLVSTYEMYCKEVPYFKGR